MLDGDSTRRKAALLVRDGECERHLPARFRIVRWISVICGP